MGFILGLLTVILAFNCIFLILLILIQLPKKEAGMGTAFGGAATDALFGAGAGNALTKVTRYSATIFFILSLILSIFNSTRSQQERGRLQKVLQKQASAAQTAPKTGTGPLASPEKPAGTPPLALGVTNINLESSTTNKAPLTIPTATNANLLVITNKTAVSNAVTPPK